METSSIDLQEFVGQVNGILDREDHQRLQASSNPFSECDSFELVVLALFMEAQGGELPPGIEDSINSIADLHAHLIRRLGVDK